MLMCVGDCGHDEDKVNISFVVEQCVNLMLE